MTNTNHTVKFLLSAGFSFLASSILISGALAEGTVQEPSQADLQNSKERGLFIEQPTIKHPPVKAVTPEAKPKAKEAKTTPKSAPALSSTSSSNSSSTGKAQKVATVKTKVRKPVENHKPTSIQVVKKSSPTDQSIKTVAYDGEGIISAWLNKPGQQPAYKDGETMEVNVKANRDCNITIYNFDGKGKLTQIFPNSFQSSAQVKAGETVSIGGRESDFEFKVGLQPGAKKTQEQIFVFAYPVNEAPLSIAMNAVPESPFRAADMTPEEYRKMVNQSKVFFSREIKVVSKKKESGSVRPASHETITTPNKIELTLTIEE
jgi:hypothetical protein